MVRKSFVKRVPNSTQQDEPSCEVLTRRSNEIDFRERCNLLETANKRLKSDLEEEINENLKKSNIIENLEKCASELETKVLGNEELVKKEKQLISDNAKKNTVIENLREEIRKVTDERESVQSSVQKSNKLMKSKDKEINDLKKGNATALDKLEKLDIEYKELKLKVNKLEKEKKKKEKAKEHKDFLNNLKLESKQIVFKCEMCDEKMETMSILRFHVQSLHVKCSATQTEETTLKTKQIQTFQAPLNIPSDKPTQTSDEISDLALNHCNHCAKRFTFKLLFNDHMKKCHKNLTLMKPFQDFPNLASPSFNPFPVGFPTLNNPFPYLPMSSFSSLQHKCGFCGWLTSRKKELKKHKMNNHGCLTDESKPP